MNNEDWGLCVWTDKRDQKVIGSNWVWYDPDVQGVGLCMDHQPSEGLGSVWTNKCSKSCLFFVYMCWCSVSFLARVDVYLCVRLSCIKNVLNQRLSVKVLESGEYEVNFTNF